MSQSQLLNYSYPIIASIIVISISVFFMWRKNPKPSPLMQAFYAGICAFIPIWFIILFEILGLLHTASTTLDFKTADENLRWNVLAIVGLISVLGATISIPVALIRIFISDRMATSSEQGLITDRFNAAVKLLGSDKTKKTADTETTVPNIELRLGGLYALERIAKDSLRDHISIMEVICAYIRENAPNLPDDDDYKVTLPPRVDIQAALTILARRSKTQRDHELADKTAPYALDLQNCYLVRAELKNAKFNHALLNYTYLTSADLTGANLTRAKLNAVDLNGAKLNEAKLNGTNLTGADLTGAYLTGAKINEDTIFIACSCKNIAVKDVDFTKCADLVQEQLDQMLGDGSTKIPEHLSRPDHWPK